MNTPTLTLKHDGKDYPNWDEQSLLAAGVPQATIDAAKLAARKADVSRECRKRIYAVAPAETQMNMAAAAALISAKTAATRSTEETAVLTGLGLAIAWVGAMRATIATQVADPAAGFTDDAAWPDCPNDALAVINQF